MSSLKLRKLIFNIYKIKLKTSSDIIFYTTSCILQKINKKLIMVGWKNKILYYKIDYYFLLLNFIIKLTNYKREMSFDKSCSSIFSK